MKVLVTRARGAATAERLRAAGHDPVLLPLLAYRDTGAALPERQHDAVVLTSAAAAATLAGRAGGLPAGLADLAVWCVGPATASAASAAGFRQVERGPGSAAELAKVLASRPELRHAGARLLYPCGEDRAFDLAAALAGQNIAVEEVPVYRAELIDPGGEALAAALAECAGGAALLYSPRSVRHLFHLAGRHGLSRRLAGLTMLAISENVAAAIPGRRNLSVLVAQGPDEDSLIDLLGRSDDRPGEAISGA